MKSVVSIDIVLSFSWVKYITWCNVREKKLYSTSKPHISTDRFHCVEQLRTAFENSSGSADSSAMWTILRASILGVFWIISRETNSPTETNVSPEKILPAE